METDAILLAVSSSEAVTRGVRVHVDARYSREQSDRRRQRWFFLYTITIKNEADHNVQLVSRRWTVTNATGDVEEVNGPGVVGQQPILRPGETFEYTSGCPLNTPFGSMRGSYEMVADSGERFFAEIAPFVLRESEAFQ